MTSSAKTLHHPFVALEALGGVFGTLLGPSHSLKCVFDPDGADETLMSSCVSTLLQHMEVVHPAGIFLRNACRAHFGEHGCGLTTLVTFTGILSRRVAELRVKGVPDCLVHHSLLATASVCERLCLKMLLRPAELVAVAVPGGGRGDIGEVQENKGPDAQEKEREYEATARRGAEAAEKIDEDVAWYFDDDCSPPETASCDDGDLDGVFAATVGEKVASLEDRAGVAAMLRRLAVGLDHSDPATDSLWARGHVDGAESENDTFAGETSLPMSLALGVVMSLLRRRQRRQQQRQRAGCDNTTQQAALPPPPPLLAAMKDVVKPKTVVGLHPARSFAFDGIVAAIPPSRLVGFRHALSLHRQARRPTTQRGGKGGGASLLKGCSDARVVFRRVVAVTGDFALRAGGWKGGGGTLSEEQSSSSSSPFSSIKTVLRGAAELEAAYVNCLLLRPMLMTEACY